jgi:hypothetical protein
MTGRFTHFIGRLSQRSAVRTWARAADVADKVELDDLKSLRTRARQVRREIDRVMRVADQRLSSSGRDAAVPRPLHADWAWRPDLWSAPVTPVGLASVENRSPFGDCATVFHDCRDSELSIRQIRNTRARDLAPYGVRLDVFRFDGSFLSLVIDLPPASVLGLKLRHLVRLDCAVEMERPIEIFARLNVQHGPNTEQVVRELPLHQAEHGVEFDLAYTKMNEKRVENAWVDIIFEGPQMNQVILRDLTLSRRPRAEI